MTQLAAELVEHSEAAISPILFGVGVFAVLTLMLLIVTRFDADR
jgi:hypothetical protein